MDPYLVAVDEIQISFIHMQNNIPIHMKKPLEQSYLNFIRDILNRTRHFIELSSIENVGKQLFIRFNEDEFNLMNACYNNGFIAFDSMLMISKLLMKFQTELLRQVIQTKPFK